MLGWKIRSLSLTLLLATAVGLATAQPSSVLDVDVDGHTGIFGRATHTGKFVGSTCTTSDECYSKNCALVKGSTTLKKCQRQPFGGPCFKDANCLTRNCLSSKGVCDNPSNLNGTCSGDPYCANGLLCDTGSGIGKCKAKTGSKCKWAGDCVSGDDCTNGVCKTPLLSPNQPCNKGSECISGGCSFGPCTLDNGDYVNCTLSLGQSGCRGYGDCAKGICKDEKCQLGADGDKCGANLQCQNLCNLDGVCYTLKNGTILATGQPCLKNSQCITNKCLYHYGVVRPSPTDDCPFDPYYPDEPCVDEVRDTVCKPGGLSGKCYDENDCAQGSCIDGVCQGRPTGSDCQTATDCTSLSCDSGKCSVAAAYSPCSSGSQCYSGKCETTDCNPDYVTACPSKFCLPVPEGQTCRQDGDCSQPYYFCDNYPGGPNICTLKG
ncbi:hypothetical protein OC846_006222 [Tilletia horrida]|uniref:Uncharacterized protein n=1 Tax=Tilletia horrida TaxID=155126 RepID=A0AAN6JP65_9BASI|nr:hypothetical protein OC846_006222 [Tilletia horrida]KAK0565163.1 hypothetical protein OC861_003898 [Tilletia horrida]